MAGVVVVNQVETLFTNERRGIVWAEVFFQDLSDTTYKVFVDLDNNNGTGPYKHTGGDGYQLKIASTSGILRKQRNGDQWAALFGVVKNIDGTNATIEWIAGSSVSSKSTSEFLDRHSETFFPALLDLSVSGGDMVSLASGFEEVVTEVNTATTLEDIKGNLVTPAAGDIVARVRKLSGTGTIEAVFSISYLVEE